MLIFLMENSTNLLFYVSGRRESNPVYIHPMDAYYRYTTARNSNATEHCRTAESNQVEVGNFSVAKLALQETFHCRDAGNRTRSLRTRSACTTGILHPDNRTSHARTCNRYTTARQYSAWRTVYRKIQTIARHRCSMCWLGHCL